MKAILVLAVLALLAWVALSLHRGDDPHWCAPGPVAACASVSNHPPTTRRSRP